MSKESFTLLGNLPSTKDWLIRHANGLTTYGEICFKTLVDIIVTRLPYYSIDVMCDMCLDLELYCSL
jgi:hypothetical protein